MNWRFVWSVSLYFALGFAALVAIALQPYMSSYHEAEYSQATNANAQTNPEPADAASPSVPTSPSAKLKPKSKERDTYGGYEERQYRLNVLLTIFNGILAAVTILLFAVGTYQGVQLRRTVDATKDAADVAKASLKLAERAHVQFSSGVSFRFDGIIPVVMCYWLTNTGHTIAHIKECKADLLFGDDAPSSLYDPLLPHPTVDAPDLASLGREQSFSDCRELDGIMSDEVRGNSSGKQLWLRGFATYYDEFGEYHVTVWCRYWIPGIDLNQSTDLAFPNEVGLNYAT